MDPIPSSVLILGGLGHVTLLAVQLCLKKQDEGRRGGIAHCSPCWEELLAQPLMDEMGFVALLQLSATASAPVSLHCPWKEVPRGRNNLPGCRSEAATQASCFL